MTIRVKLFAILRERAGVSEVVVDLPDGATAAAAGDAVFERFPQARQAGRSIAYAVNRSYAPAATVMRDGDELALIPPVSGG